MSIKKNKKQKDTAWNFDYTNEKLYKQITEKKKQSGATLTSNKGGN